MGKASMDKRVDFLSFGIQLHAILEFFQFETFTNKLVGFQDMYYRKAEEESWRARNAFPLQIDEEFNNFEGKIHNRSSLCSNYF